MQPVKVLVVYGSETGNVRRGIHECVKAWQASTSHGAIYTLANADVVTGNDAALEYGSLSEIAHQFDCLIVATSSFGEGDPPANFASFLLMLVRAHIHRKPLSRPPLAGLQHAVIGYGQSIYPTFQSCPRFTDKLLESLGSRRMVRRVEVDEGPTETIAPGVEEDPGYTTMGTGELRVEAEIKGRSVALDEFSQAVHTALLNASSTAVLPPVCPWTEPGDGTVHEKTVEDLLHARPQTLESDGLPQWLKYVGVALMAAAAMHYYHELLAAR